MNKIEFNEIIKVFGLNDTLCSRLETYGRIHKYYNWKNLEIYFGDSYYAIVHGKIPLEVANIIYNKYPNNPYSIRVDGGNIDWIPEKYAIDSKYEDNINSYTFMDLTTSEYIKKCKNAIKNLKRRTDKNKYLTTYHIDTKEGLLIFLTEINNYYKRMNNKDEIDDNKYDELLKKANIEILKQINPTISAYNWMQDDIENKEIYNKVIEIDTKTKLGCLFRKAIENFDESINPFIDKDINLYDINNDNITINANKFNSFADNDRENCCYLEIKENGTHNSIEHFRLPEGFSFKLYYQLDNDNYLNVTHYYSNKSYNLESNKGEIIEISYLEKESKKEMIITFNLTNGTIYKNNKEIPVTFEEIALIYDKLLKAIEYASRITKNNIKKKNNCKQLIRKKR